MAKEYKIQDDFYYQTFILILRIKKYFELRKAILLTRVQSAPKQSLHHVYKSHDFKQTTPRHDSDDNPVTHRG